MIIVVPPPPVVTPPGGGTGGGTGTGGGSGQPAVLPDYAYHVTLTGIDGSVWDLNGGPVTLQGGVKGLLSATPVTHWTKTSPMVYGSRWTGMRVEQKDLPLPFCTRGRTWDEWRDVDNRFFRAIAPEGEATITVTAPDAVSRTLKVRFVTDGEPEDDWDPLLTCYRDYVIEFIAANPFWAGPTVTRSFGLTSTPWLVPPGPPMVINTVSPLGSAFMPNLGDVPVWPRYTINGPASSFRVGVGDSVVASSTPIAAGSKVVIDSAPTAQGSIVNEYGMRVYENMSEVTFAQIPVGTSVPITVDVVGSGLTTGCVVELTPLYRRPV